MTSSRPDLAELEAGRARSAPGEPGVPAIPRPSDLSLDSSAGRHRPVGDDRSAAGAAHHDCARTLPSRTPDVVRDETSVDGTRKLVLGLADGRMIESVFIPDTPSMTFCVSTQVGCAMGCGFCLTGQMGLVRHLTAGEIVGQVRVLAARTGMLERPFNIVLMGMGEPLHNYDNTMKALRMLHSEHGLSVSPRRVTLSTVGIVPALDRLAQEPLMPNLAVSLHATTDEQRTALVPPNRKYPLADILDACRRFPLKKRSRITFEYVLLAGVNDSAGGCATARAAAARIESEGESDSAESGAGHSLRAAVRRSRRSLRTDPGRPSPHGLGSEEPRTRHPRGLRSADRRRRARARPPRSRWRC